MNINELNWEILVQAVATYQNNRKNYLEWNGTFADGIELKKRLNAAKEDVVRAAEKVTGNLLQVQLNAARNTRKGGAG